LALRARAETLDRERNEWRQTVLRDPDPDLRAMLDGLLREDGSQGEEDVPPMDTSATLTTLERVLFLRQVPLFARLEPEDLQHVAEAMVERVYDSGDVLVREGDLGDEMLVIVEGSVQVTKRSEDGERTLRRLEAGAHVGELAILREQPRSATVAAQAGPVRVLALRGDALTAILQDRPDVSLALLTSLAERLSTLT
jgi:hypothetical protein